MPPAATLASTRVLVLTASDRCAAGQQEDRSGPAVVEGLRAAGAETIETLVLSDDLSVLRDALRNAAQRCDLILTTGGTGLGARDNTPEATLAVAERQVPGLAELIRRAGEQQTAFAALGRGVAAVAGTCLIVNLPGSPRGAAASLATILPLLPHALALLGGDTRHDR